MELMHALNMVKILKMLTPNNLEALGYYMYIIGGMSESRRSNIFASC